MITRGILQHIEPALWMKHKFGIPHDRWSRLRGGSFWITGGGTGYGRAIALALTAAGARTFITGRRIAKLEETISEGRDLGIDVEHCYPIAADITSEIDLENAIKKISSFTECLSGVINSAALPQPDSGNCPLASMSIHQWDNLIKTNVTAQWLVSKAALTLFAKSNVLRMLYLTSEAGWADTPGFGPYNITKSAVNSIGLSFAAECKIKYSNKDVQINVLVPGEAKTEMNSAGTGSPYAVVSMVMSLMSHPTGGPNGHFFHRDGRHLSFGYSSVYSKDLLSSN